MISYKKMIQNELETDYTDKKRSFSATKTGKFTQIKHYLSVQIS